MQSTQVRFNPRSALAAVALLMVSLLVVTPAMAETVYLDFSNQGLEDLGPNFVYEGWLIVDGAPVSTGTFMIDSAGQAVPSRFAVDLGAASAASTFVLTIEPVPDMDSAPSPVHVLAGDFAAGVAELGAGHPAALGDDFTSASAPYILNAPSGADQAEYFNGIWWLDPSAGPGPSLDLPTLPEGWVYEGWVVGADGPMSTGRFTSASGDDSDAGGITSGPFSTPPFPGQDLVVPPVDLTSDYAAVISVEPSPDNSAGPFAFKPLVDTMIEALGAGVPQDMANMAANLPTARVMMASPAMTTETAHLMLNFQGLEDLGADYAYEGWIIVDGSPVSTGVFTVSGGVASAVYFPTEVASLDAISTFVLTIEPIPDTDPAPSHVHLLGGDFAGNRAALGIDHGAALGTDFSDASGAYILNTPSADGSVPYTHGIWWLDPPAGPGPTLVLPTLPNGWIYEGWVAGADGPLSTGRFSMASGQDSDGAGETGGSAPFPPFPGQDFVNPPTDLSSGFAAVISVEPDPDNSPAPFAIKPLMDPMIDAIGAGVLQPMHLNTAALPAGSAVLAEPTTILAGASAIGVGGARWFTDLDVANDGAGPANVLFQLLRSDQSNMNPETVHFSIAAGGAMRYEDAFAELFDYTGTGAVRIISDSEAVRSTSRSYAAADAGTYGQGIPSFSSYQALQYGDTGRLVQLAQDDVFRSNIGFVNAGNNMVDVVVELFDATGRMVGTRSVTLAAAEHQQLNGVFPETVTVGYARVYTTTPGGAFWAYGSVVDNGVDDPTFIMVQ